MQGNAPVTRMVTTYPASWTTLLHVLTMNGHSSGCTYVPAQGFRMLRLLPTSILKLESVAEVAQVLSHGTMSAA